MTRTRGIARLVEEREARERLGPAGLAAEVPVHVSGCPNGCSQHHFAAIGLQGSARKLGGRAVPQYFVLVGGGVGDGEATFGRLAGKVPARRLPEAVSRLAELYLAERGEVRPPARSSRACSIARRRRSHRSRRSRRRTPHRRDFIEPGASEDFSPDTQAGECAA